MTPANDAEQQEVLMILVTGASGSIGRRVVRHLAERGATFKVLVRDAAKGKALGCDFVVGDLDRPDTVASALAGVEQLFLNVNASESMVRQQTGAIDAAKVAGVSHIVKVSTIGSNAASPMSIPRWHGQIDAHLEASGLRSSILQPCVFMQNFCGQAESIRNEGRFFGAFGEGRVPFIDVDDIAASGVSLLVKAREGGRFPLTGGEELSHADVAQRLGSKLGKSVVYIDRPVEDVVNAMKSRGMPANFAEDLGTMMGFIAKGGAPKATTTVKDVTGRAPRTFDQFFDDNRSTFSG